jgi:hypothetical protein
MTFTYSATVSSTTTAVMTECDCNDAFFSLFGSGSNEQVRTSLRLNGAILAITTGCIPLRYALVNASRNDTGAYQCVAELPNRTHTTEAGNLGIIGKLKHKTYSLSAIAGYLGVTIPPL